MRKVYFYIFSICTHTCTHTYTHKLICVIFSLFHAASSCSRLLMLLLFQLQWAIFQQLLLSFFSAARNIFFLLLSWNWNSFESIASLRERIFLLFNKYMYVWRKKKHVYIFTSKAAPQQLGLCSWLALERSLVRNPAATHLCWQSQASEVIFISNFNFFKLRGYLILDLHVIW